MSKKSKPAHPYLKRSPNWISGLRPTQELGSNPKDEHGFAKVPLALVSPIAMSVEALCMEDGGYKYGPYNYRISKVQSYVYAEAILRHTYAFLEGEDYDPATGKPHLGYARANTGILLDAWFNEKLIDNRPVPGKGAEILNAFALSPGQQVYTAEENRKLFEKIRRGL